MVRTTFFTKAYILYKGKNGEYCREESGEGIDGIIIYEANARDELRRCGAMLTLLCQAIADSASILRLQKRAKEAIKEDSGNRDCSYNEHLGDRNQAKCQCNKWNDRGKGKGGNSSYKRYASADSLLALSKFKEIKGTLGIATE